jgi:hypothetical protein
MDEKKQDTPNPPLVIGTPVPPMSLSELKAWHAANGTLREFLASIDYERER